MQVSFRHLAFHFGSFPTFLLVARLRTQILILFPSPQWTWICFPAPLGAWWPSRLSSTVVVAVAWVSCQGWTSALPPLPLAECLPLQAALWTDCRIQAVLSWHTASGHSLSLWYVLTYFWPWQWKGKEMRWSGCSGSTQFLSSLRLVIHLLIHFFKKFTSYPQYYLLQKIVFKQIDKILTLGHLLWPRQRTAMGFCCEQTLN